MGDENELSAMADEEWILESLYPILGEEEIGKLRYADDGTEYHLVVMLRRGQPK